MNINPPSSARTAINDSLGEVTRRVEIYEQDGTTLWLEGAGDRLIDGSISVTYGDNERRTVDVTLANTDNALRSQPGGFWYDKVLKLYRGVKYNGSLVQPSVAIIEATGGVASGYILAGKIARAGIPDAEVLLNSVSSEALKSYDVIVSYTTTNASTKATVLKELYAAGKSIITISSVNGTSVLPFVTSTATFAETIGVSQPATPTILSDGWTTEAQGSTTATVPTALDGSATVVSRWQRPNTSYVITGAIATNKLGGKWFDLHLQSLNGTNTLQLLANAVAWIRGSGKEVNWETQIGEFVIDGINSDLYPSGVKVTGRDYTKKCMNSKIENAVSFPPETSVTTLVTALAANSGITKFRIAHMPETLEKTMSFDRGVPRWDIMRDAATAQGYEIFFDQEGFLVTRKFQDPTFGFPTETFLTGPEGNLASLSRSVNDSRIYNHIAVYGDPSSGETRLPYLGRAINTNPTSPTNVDEIGDRYYSYASTFFTNQQQCQDYANRLLSLHALESFELSFSAINYPWMEVGEIAKVLDPKAVATDPDQYLIDTLTIPLSLGPMSFTGKRVTMVG